MEATPIPPRVENVDRLRFVPMYDARALSAVAKHPSLWLEAMRALLAVAPDGWWRRRRRFGPEPGYLAWRLLTAYASSTAAIDPDDVVTYLRWRRRQRA